LGATGGLEGGIAGEVRLGILNRWTAISSIQRKGIARKTRCRRPTYGKEDKTANENSRKSPMLANPVAREYD